MGCLRKPKTVRDASGRSDSADGIRDEMEFHELARPKRPREIDHAPLLRPLRRFQELRRTLLIVAIAQSDRAKVPVVPDPGGAGCLVRVGVDENRRWVGGQDEAHVQPPELSIIATPSS